MGCGTSLHLVTSPNQRLPRRSIDGSYRIGKIVGRGTFSVCLQAEALKGGMVVVKKLARSNVNFNYNNILKEVRIMKKLSHPGLIRLQDYFEDQEAVYLVQELANGGDLFDRVVEGGAIPEPASVFICRQILYALGYLHENNVCHRDLKPENILFLSSLPGAPGYDIVKITDFGLSTDKAVGYTDTMSTVCGTPDYTAPELLAAAGTSMEGRMLYSCKVDIWSVGAILYMMLGGKAPFKFTDSNTTVVLQKILTGEYSFPDKYWENVSDNAIISVRAMMQVDPRMRPTASECLELDWFEEDEERRMQSLGLHAETTSRKTVPDPHARFVLANSLHKPPK